MDPMGDFEKILKGSRPMEKEGIESIQLATRTWTLEWKKL